MQSRTSYLTSLAPIAVALSLALVGPAFAQDYATDGTPQLIVSSPLDAVAGSLPMSIFENAEQEPASEAAEFTKSDFDSAKTEPATDESQASVYSPAHLQIRTTPIQAESETKTAVASETTSAAEPTDRASDRIAIASAATDVAAPAQVDAISNGAAAVSTDLNSTADTAKSIQQAEVSTTEVTDLTPVSLDTPEPGVQLRGAPTVQTDTTADAPLGPNDIAQSVPTDTVGGSNGDTRDFDLTPVSLPRRTPTFNRMEGFSANALYRLPGRLFFSALVDNSLRCETNVFQTKSHNKTDMIYRVLPNTTLGWALTRSTRVSANYFFLRDQYTKYAKTLDRNFHSVGFQIDQDLYNKNRTSVTLGFFGRALFTTPDEFSDQFFNDLIPSLTVTRQVGYSTVLYGSVLGQIRFREMLSKFQEGDQFYSFGAVHRKNRWTLLGDFTLNNNFGNSNLRQGENNQVIILTEELAYRLPKIKLPMDVYCRAQQIFNMGANNSPGYAGVNTRVFGGIRAFVSKPVVMPVKLAEK
jgi:hypothetical protein